MQQSKCLEHPVPFALKYRPAPGGLLALFCFGLWGTMAIVNINNSNDASTLVDEMVGLLSSFSSLMVV